MVYREIDKMSDLLSHDKKAIQTVSRFGIPMGVGDKTIEAVCQEHGIHTSTFLAIINFCNNFSIINYCDNRSNNKFCNNFSIINYCDNRSNNKFSNNHSNNNFGNNHPDAKMECVGTPGDDIDIDKDIDIDTLRTYIKNAHSYFLDFQLPRLRRQLIEAINPTVANTQIPLLIIRYYDEYVQEIRTHIRHEDEGLFEAHESDDRNIAYKLHELVNLIIKYYPAHSTYPFSSELMSTVLLGIYQLEDELQTHCAIEDYILRPALLQHKKKKVRTDTVTAQEELSEREKEVLKLVVQGLINKEIADRLHLSLHTIITHRKNIARKLNIHSTAGLTIYAIVNHLVELDN